MSKLLGYILAGIGLIGTAIATVPQISTFLTTFLALPASLNEIISSIYFLGASAVLVIAGILLTYKGGGSKQPAEVPIYQGKNVIGYRRMGK